MNVFQKTIKGMGYLEGYGEHPGWSMLALFVGLGAVAGIPNGILNILSGALVMLVGVGCVFAFGAYSRYCHWENSQMNKDPDE